MKTNMFLSFLVGIFFRDLFCFLRATNHKVTEPSVSVFETKNQVHKALAVKLEACKEVSRNNPCWGMIGIG